MKKKATLIITIVALVTMAIVGGTLAWFTDSAAVTNVLKAGKIDISLDEEHFTGGTAILPGDTITKDPVITNNGAEAKIRYKVNVVITKGDTTMPLPTGNDALVFNEAIAGLVINGENWTELTGTLATGASQKLFESVSIPASWGNEYQEATLTIKVEVQAAQAKNFDAASWATVPAPEVVTLPKASALPATQPAN